jgi:NitT/TauT family transport system substrate-binding protein
MLRLKFIAVLGLIVLILIGCAVPVPSQVQSEQLTEASSTEPLILKIGVMPAVDAAPIFFASKNGYFKELNLTVDIQVFTNALDRQSALQTHEIDGAMSDMIALIMNVQGGFDLKGTTMTDGMFPVVERKDLVPSTERMSVALMEVSVINYLADHWFSDVTTLDKVFINEIPGRLEMVKNGNVDLGIFPEPVASMAMLDGYTKVIYEMPNDYCPDVFVFTGKAIRENQQAIEAFHRAYDRAVVELQKDADLAKDILIESFKFNPLVRDFINLPTYHTTRLPDASYVDSITMWASRVLNKELDVTVEDVFDRSFVR